jgi:hypothetical protein
MDKKQFILDSLFTHCKIRTYTSKEVLNRLLNDMNVQFLDKFHKVADDKLDQVIEIIREYKNTGKNLETTVNLLYDIIVNPIINTNIGINSTNTTNSSSNTIDNWSDDDF